MTLPSPAQDAPAQSADIDLAWSHDACVACMSFATYSIARRFSCEFRLADPKNAIDLRQAGETMFFLISATRAHLSVRGCESARAFAAMHALLKGEDERALAALHCRS